MNAAEAAPRGETIVVLGATTKLGANALTFVVVVVTDKAAAVATTRVWRPVICRACGLRVLFAWAAVLVAAVEVEGTARTSPSYRYGINIVATRNARNTYVSTVTYVLHDHKTTFRFRGSPSESSHT